VYLAKMATALLGVTLIWLLILGLGGASLSLGAKELFTAVSLNTSYQWQRWGVAVVEALAWGVLCSLVVRRVIVGHGSFRRHADRSAGLDGRT
jgi:hypothetical protein